VQILSQGFCGGVAEHLFGGMVPEGYLSIIVHHDDGIAGVISNRVKFFIVFPQCFLDLFPFADVDTQLIICPGQIGSSFRYTYFQFFVR